MIGMIWRQARREIWANRSFSLFFVLNISLGLFGFVAITAFRQSMSDSLAAKSRAILAGDVGLTGRRALTEAELQRVHAIVGPAAQRSRVTGVYSMIAVDAGTASRLAELVAIDETYPLYGRILLTDKREFTAEVAKPVVDGKRVWLAPELASQLGVAVGSNIRIGRMVYVLDGLIADDPAVGQGGFSLAPRVYIGRERIDGDLINAVGSTLNHRYLFRLPAGADEGEILRQLNETITDPGIRVINHRRASEQMGRALDYLTDYLGLVALVALVLALLGAGYLYRSFLTQKQHDIAVLMSLGLTPRRARWIFVWQLTMLGVVAAAVALVAAIGVLPVVASYLGKMMQLSVAVTIDQKTVLAAIGIAVASSVLTCLPQLAQMKDLTPADLFQENERPRIASVRWSAALNYAPLVLFLFGMSVWQAQSWRVGGLFSSVLLGAALLAYGLGRMLLQLLSVMMVRAPLILRMAMRHMTRSPVSSLSCFVAISLGALLVNLVPLLKSSIASEIERPDGSQLPALFLFDIQDEQLAELKEVLAQRHIVEPTFSPMVRARLLSVNGKEFTKDQADTQDGSRRSREEEQQAQSRNRSYNLSYRDGPSAAETLVSGRAFSTSQGHEAPDQSPGSNSLPEISLEQRFAERLGVGLGDKMQFDVQGVDVEGVVINTRSVRWTSFEPNFFITFAPGALNDAPKIWLSAIKGVTGEAKSGLQQVIVSKFPNISIIDVSALVTRLLGVFTQMSWALELMAYLALFSGFVVLYSIAQHQATSRQRETALFKVLGGRFGDIRRLYVYEFVGLTLLAALAGTALAIVMSRIFVVYVFSGAWVFEWRLPVLTVFAISILSLLVSLVATARQLRQSPSILLA